MDSVKIAIEMITGTSNNTVYARWAIALALPAGQAGHCIQQRRIC